MKKITILLLTVLSISFTYAQKDVAEATAGTIAPTTEEGEKAWKFGGGAGLFASQVHFVNWAAGGVSSISGVLNGDIFANLRKGKHSWENNFKGEWGMIKNDGADLSKNKDFLDLNSKYGYQVDKKGKVFVGALMNFNSQFTQTNLEGTTTGEYISNFLAPGRLTLAAGLDWKPSDMFSLFFSPAAGKFTFVTDNGVDEETYGLEAGTNVRTEFGAYLKALFQKELMKNVNFKTGLGLYNNYMDASENGANRGNIDVDWTTGIDLIVNKWITVNFGTQLIYDHDVDIATKDENDVETVGPRTQFAENLSVGFTYRFEPKDKKKVK